MAAEHRITEEILKKTLANKHEAHPNDVQIKGFSVSEGYNKGDGFTCQIKKVNVTAEVRDKVVEDHIMFKCVPMGDHIMEFIKVALVFRTETTSYKDILPKLHKIAQEHGIEKLCAPKFYYGDEDEGVLAMEDLREAGFAMKRKEVGFSVPEMKLFLRELAKIHALSHHFLESYIGGVERFRKDYWYMNGAGWLHEESRAAIAMMDKITRISFALGVMGIEESPDHKDLLEPLKDFVNERFWDIKDKPHYPKGPFNCLIHNDAWCNNALVRGSPDGEATDICLIDFQLVRRARPTVDLVYCLVSSMAPEVRKANLDELLSYYHKELLMLLIKLGYSEDVYTYQQLKEDYAETFPHGFSIGLMHVLIQEGDSKSKERLDFQELFSAQGEDAMKKINECLRMMARTDKKKRQRIVDLVLEAREMKVF